jgi:hypothetical protein
MVDEHGQVKVLDFGLAKLTERSVSEDGATAAVGVKTDEGAIAGGRPVGHFLLRRGLLTR